MVVPVIMIGLAALGIFYFAVRLNIRLAFYVLLAANFLSVGLTRYLPYPLGLSMDALLLSIFLFHFFVNSVKWIGKNCATPFSL